MRGVLSGMKSRRGRGALRRVLLPLLLAALAGASCGRGPEEKRQESKSGRIISL